VQSLGFPESPYSQPSTNMFKVTHKRRATTLSKTLITAGLLGAAALTTLGTGSAQAATGCGVQITWSTWIGGTSLTCGDNEYTHASTGVLGDLGSSLVSAVEPVPGAHIFNLDKDFTSTPFDFTYVAMITKPGSVFDLVDLDSDAIGFANPPSELEATYTFTGGNSPIMLTSTNGSSSVAPVTGGPTKITVNNRYNGAGGAIDTLENSFRQTHTVPGPLPLLGAGAAFGFSRNLRKRIKTRKSPGVMSALG
jgi:hypothetical protein